MIIFRILFCSILMKLKRILSLLYF
jgi:hypothetical protein